MRVLLGIDTYNAYPPAIQMVLNLGLPGVEVDLMHVIESVLPDGVFPEVRENHPLMQMYREHERQGQEALDSAAGALGEAGIKSRTFLQKGDVAKTLIEHADKERCELVAARTALKGYYGSLFFGSVAKGLVIGAHQSILIVKGEDLQPKRLNVVFATDHSPYCDRCVDLLAAMAPKGIAHVTVMTANEMSAGIAGLLVNDLPDLKDVAPHWIQEKIEERNQAICEKLAPLGAKCESRIVDGHPNEAIKQVMEETKADLLIIGAQGHGFFERLTIGSKSFHQVVSEPYSVLVLRPQTKAVSAETV